MKANIPENAQDRAAFTYNAAADYYDASPLSFWDYFGRQTIELASLRIGSRVLDVCCGAGASALPAAEAVGQTGAVIGVDLAKALLESARTKAIQRRLGNIEFEVGDMLSMTFPVASFDAVVCVFGIFFVPDMAMAVSELWSYIRPGGKLAVTTWGRNLFEPANDAFWCSIKVVRPDRYKGFNPWDRIDNQASLRKILDEAGVASPKIIAENRLHPIKSAEDWWTIVLGSGYRGTIEQLNLAERQKVKEANLDFIRDEKISAIETNVLCALATKPQTANFK
ncbi:MAG: ubiquinone biosynthesis protein UbiE [Verrucomicrobia bacterium]|nr:MAG: ubiquinone biosynthesis protein UbiE [Verrucomicrobia bacterium 13_2_20CM_2_54_15_9cls]PYI42822.1 MAG: ubiquinone biosynthesis protein UbiE [Verrucomicrobiota bacterium]